MSTASMASSVDSSVRTMRIISWWWWLLWSDFLSIYCIFRCGRMVETKRTINSFKYDFAVVPRTVTETQRDVPQLGWDALHSWPGRIEWYHWVRFSKLWQSNAASLFRRFSGQPIRSQETVLPGENFELLPFENLKYLKRQSRQVKAYLFQYYELLPFKNLSQ